MKVFSIFDKSAHVFGGLMLSNNEALMKRQVKSVLAAKGFGKEIDTYPDDFELWQIGDFNEETGVISSDPCFLVGIDSLKAEINNG